MVLLPAQQSVFRHWHGLVDIFVIVIVKIVIIIKTNIILLLASVTLANICYLL